ncbi:MAG: hypothetical protein MI922_25005 [Bacteroidales bacterium]|nr:hypothetical protein [Bacteroidales bacterium]
MKKLFNITMTIGVALMVLTACDNDEVKPDPETDPNTKPDASYIASYEQAKESVLRSIPEEYINKARTSLHIAYQHTSHGTHVSYGMYGLPGYKTGDETLFAISNSKEDGKLEFNDYALANYAADGVDASDLSRNETAFIQATRNYLDAPSNAHINVVMWSWCNIAGHDVETNYLPGMQTLINEYGEGGSKIGVGNRTSPVTFIFMTGHANRGANNCNQCPKQQADTIIGFCKAKKQYCLDYFGIDSHDMDDNYWEDVNDNGESASYDGNFYQDWQDAQVLGESYYANKNAPGGRVTFGAHTSQHITSNRKAYAMWYILAKIAGWDGTPAE